jgi:peptide deformylase
MNKREAADKLVLWPHPILQKRAEEVTVFDERLAQLAIDLLMVLKNVDGLGLSACQIGDRRAVIAYKTDGDSYVMVNPTIIYQQDMAIRESEGCLSLPGIYIKVTRPGPAIHVRYQDLDGEWHTREFKGVEARIIQHELDHLAGKTILSYLSKLKRDMLTAKMVKLQKQIARSEREHPGAKMRALRTPHGPARRQP